MPEPITMALMAAGTLLGGFGSLGTSPQEKASQAALDRLNSNEGWLKSTPYSKDEVMNYLIPKLQKTYRSAADVVAGKVGAGIGEMGNADFMNYYTQALGDVIGQGEQAAAGIEADMNKWFASLDDAAKNRFLQSIQLELQAAGGLPNMNEIQRFITGALGGLQLGATAGSNITQAGALLSNANATGDMINNLYGSGGDIASVSKSSMLKPTLNVGEEMSKYMRGKTNG